MRGEADLQSKDEGDTRTVQVVLVLMVGIHTLRGIELEKR